MSDNAAHSVLTLVNASYKDIACTANVREGQKRNGTEDIVTWRATDGMFLTRALKVL